MMKIFNSLTSQKQNFKPLNKGSVDMYICGMTVYDDCHLGHARTFVAFDMIVRYLRYKGFTVNYVRNITDVDDKIITRAKKEGLEPHYLTANYIKRMHEDFLSLGMIEPDFEPKATKHIPDIINLISNLISKDYAYHNGGNVYFSVKSFSQYGKLSKRNVDDMEAGARVDVDSLKRNPADFVLWKKDNKDTLKWDSPWGKGRPGWHIECSAMSMKNFGDNFDIHGGGSDLKFPHHENEIAQSECSTGKSFANYWMHTGPLRVNNEKMSKSLDNFFTVRSVLDSYHPEVIRFFLLSSHYRSPLNYDLNKLDEAKVSLERLYGALRGLKPIILKKKSAYFKKFELAMDNDFNTPKGLAILFDIAREVNILKLKDLKAARNLASELLLLAEPLGLLKLNPDIFYQDLHLKSDISEEEILDLINKRDLARENKRFKEADAIRVNLEDKGVLLDDRLDGTIWKRK